MITRTNVEQWLRERGYSDHLIKDQADWLIESWNEELPHLRHMTFQHLCSSFGGYEGEISE